MAMRSAAKCLECGLEQCGRILRLVNGDEQGWEMLKPRLVELAASLSLEEPPGSYTSKLLLATMEFLELSDPFAQVKEKQNRESAAIARELDRQLGDGEAALRQALLVAAAGNVIDVGPGKRFELMRLLGARRFVHDDSELLISRLRSAKRVMYILDNSGEVMFDILVLKRLPRVDLTIVARSYPILNDVTVAEAAQLGLNQYGRLIGTGSRYLGVDLQTVSSEFLAAFQEAEVVIAKGHANFEALVDGPRNGFYLLTAKCELVAERLGVKPGEAVCFYSPGKGG
jgi:uncharacterized protein with ATP-grasp and redox domains